MMLFGIMGFCDAAESAFNAIFNVLKTITTVIGAIFLIVGIVRFIIAHANEDGPNQQKAAMLIATGIALVIIGPVLSTLIPATSLIDTSYTNSSGDKVTGGTTGTGNTPDYDAAKEWIDEQDDTGGDASEEGDLE